MGYLKNSAVRGLQLVIRGRIAVTVPRSLLADLALLLVTLVWGSTFVMVKDAVTAYPVFRFLSIRFTFAALALLPAILVWGLPARRARIDTAGSGVPGRARSLLPAFLIGAVLFTGISLQTAGLRLTTPAKAGFITGLSVVIVPVVAALVLRRSPNRTVWAGVGMATLGLALLSLEAGFSIAIGDLLVLACAFAFATHILLTGRFAPHHSPLLLTFGQVLAVAVLSAVASLLFESPVAPDGKVLAAAAITGILATAAAFGIQTFAQGFTSTTHTALIFACEPVFAGLFSFLLIGEALGPRQLAGCGLILAGMIAGELGRQA